MFLVEEEGLILVVDHTVLLMRFQETRLFVNKEQQARRANKGLRGHVGNASLKRLKAKPPSCSEEVSSPDAIRRLFGTIAPH